jgi:AcrR family transcriptional regulator
LKRRRAYHHLHLDQALVDAALARIADTGLSGWSLRELARDAGVSPGAPYHHFADRAALLAAVAEAGFRELVRVQTAALAASSADPDARILALGVAYVTFAAEHRAHFQAMFRADLGSWERFPGLREAAHVAFVLLEASVREAGRPAADARTIWALVHGIATLWVDGPLRDHAPEGHAAFARKALARLLA